MSPDDIWFKDIPVRQDATLCDPEEIWVEHPNGCVERIYPLKPLPPEADEPEQEGKK